VSDAKLTIEQIIAESDRRDRRNRTLARSWATILGVVLILLAFSRSQNPDVWYIVLIYALSFLASRSHSTRFRHFGWAFVALLFLLVYLPTVHPVSFSWADVRGAFAANMLANTQIITEDAANFKDAYIIIGSAAFTLYGFFFLASRRVERIQLGVRLYTIAQVFGAVLTLSVTATLLPNAGWWRYAILVFIAAGTLFALGREPRPYIIDASVDRPGVATFWDAWLRNRTGQAIQAFTGLFILPLWPVLGEVLFVFGLLYLLIIAAYTSTYLFLSSELPNTARTDEQLRLLYSFNINRDFADLPYRATLPFGTRSDRSEQVKSIPFQFPRTPQ